MNVAGTVLAAAAIAVIAALPVCLLVAALRRVFPARTRA